MGCGGSKKAADATEPAKAADVAGSGDSAKAADATDTKSEPTQAGAARAVAPPAGAAQEETTGDLGSVPTEETDQAGADGTDKDVIAPGDSQTDTTGPAAAAAAPLPEPELPFQERRYKELAAQTEVPANVSSSQPRRPSSSGTMLSEYAAKHAASFNEVLRMEPLDGWNFKKEEDGVKIYLRAEPDMPVYSFKGVSEFPLGAGGISEVLYGLLDVDRRPEWDEMCIFGKMIEQYVPFYRVTHVAMRAPFPISERDLLIMGRLRFEEDGSIVVHMKSTEHPDVPETPKYVRVNFVKGGYIIRPTSDPGKVQVTWTGCIEPKGWLPSWLVNMVAWKQALSLAKFRKQRLSGAP